MFIQRIWYNLNLVECWNISYNRWSPTWLLATLICSIESVKKWLDHKMFPTPYPSSLLHVYIHSYYIWLYQLVEIHMHVSIWIVFHIESIKRIILKPLLWKCQNMSNKSNLTQYIFQNIWSQLVQLYLTTCYLYIHKIIMFHCLLKSDMNPRKISFVDCNI